MSAGWMQDDELPLDDRWLYSFRELQAGARFSRWTGFIVGYGAGTVVALLIMGLFGR
ncbi:hypothetical protein UFOVP143_47 [uncultured Caudovirales phage]|uniref:Uncharacterized protein n=1 Tax=uncultured Caudovirales phage TaxID=2100421 RepID=A0A6J7VJP0_9CAUD|nr:hypothetical protein UFOVP143_47 [uncultured Caudovirales phage]